MPSLRMSEATPTIARPTAACTHHARVGPRLQTSDTNVPAAEIIAALPPEIIKAGVFVNAPAELVSEAISRCGLNYLQFHARSKAAK